MRKYIYAGLALVMAVAMLPIHANGQDPKTTVDGRVVKTEKSTKKIPFKIRYVPDRNVGAGRIVPGDDGEDGVETTIVTREYKDGKVIASNTLTEVTKKPVDKIFKVGIEGHSSVSRGSYTRGKVIEVVATAYMANEGRMNPGSRTATGRRAEYGIVAVDPRVIPLHSILYVEGYGLAIAADTGGSIKGNRIDVCVSSRSEMRSWGRKKVVVHVLRKEEPAKNEEEKDDSDGGDGKFVALPVLAPMTDGELLAYFQDQEHANDPASTPGLTADEAARAKSGNTKKPDPIKTTTPPPAPVKPAPAKPKFPREATVAKTDVIVRSKPSSESDRVAVVGEGDSVTIWGDVKGWFRVKLENGKAGYIRADMLGGAAPASTKKIQVNRDNVIVRKDASTDSGRVDLLKQGESVIVVGEKDGWKKVKLSNGKTGYIRSDMLGASAPASTKGGKSMKVVHDQVLVREKANTGSARVGSLSKGDSVTVLGKASGWYKIKLESGKTGYVRADMLGGSGTKSTKKPRSAKR
ncbi:MAG: SH3 domain-containing protein [Armatimonadetes bacterium]|nr:SH3 domain-containing protein [Armatimonadota bacterium]